MSSTTRLSDQVTLESTCKENNAEYEWGGSFATPANAYKWVAEAREIAIVTREIASLM